MNPFTIFAQGSTLDILMTIYTLAVIIMAMAATVVGGANGLDGRDSAGRALTSSYWRTYWRRVTLIPFWPIVLVVLAIKGLIWVWLPSASDKD